MPLYSLQRPASMALTAKFRYWSRHVLAADEVIVLVAHSLAEVAGVGKITASPTRDAYLAGCWQ
ncbi:hypothetical protein, partial [Mycobacterium avium]